MQGALAVISHTTTSPSAGTYEKEARPIPVLVPFTFHWYSGFSPPLTGDALNVTRFPWQVGLTEGVIDTLAYSGTTIVIEMGFDITGLLAGHAIEEVMRQVITSPFIGV